MTIFNVAMMKPIALRPKVNLLIKFPSWLAMTFFPFAHFMQWNIVWINDFPPSLIVVTSSNSLFIINLEWHIDSISGSMASIMNSVLFKFIGLSSGTWRGDTSAMENGNISDHIHWKMDVH